MQKAIIIGASSGIGNALTKLLIQQNYKVGIIARREDLLNEMVAQHPKNVVSRCFDITQKGVTEVLSNLVDEIGSVDLFVFCAGTGELNEELNYNIEESTNKLNVTSFTETINWVYRYFENQNKGHLVVVSSIAGIRGGDIAPSYNASKAYQINYLEGLQKKAKKTNKNISITDVRPGFVDTAMAKGEGLFWVATKEKAAKQIYSAILKKKKVVYVTKRWRLIAFILKTLPKRIYIKHF